MSDSTAQRIIEALGGIDNVESVENCITRLRIPVRDESIVDPAEVKAVEGVLGVVPDQTMQVILGPGLVDEVADEIEAILAERPASEPTAAAAATTPGEGGKAADLQERGQKIGRAHV